MAALLMAQGCALDVRRAVVPFGSVACHPLSLQFRNDGALECLNADFLDPLISDDTV